MEYIKERSETVRETQVEDWLTGESAWTGYFGIGVRALRISQWIKNVLLFIPFFLAHKVLNIHDISTLLCAWLSFSLCASSTYIVNDICDIESDREHPQKCRRPFASNELSIRSGIVLSICSMIVGLMIAIIFIRPVFLIIIGFYVIISLLYSFGLKKLLLADLLILAILYVLRIFAGGLILNIPISNWLLSFSLFLFVSLAFLKRYAELHLPDEAEQNYDNRRFYDRDDLELLQVMGVSTGLLSILVLTLYFHSDAVASQYSHPEWLWFTAPLLFYWIGRLWFLASRRIVRDDPVIFSLKDKVSYLVGGIMVLIFILSSYL